MAQEKGRESARDAARGDDYEFIPPDFDEDAFIHREMVSFRTTLILFVWAIVAAAVSWAAFGAMHGARTGWLVGLVLCAAFGYALRFLFPRLGADIKHFAARDWLGTAALFFFTWLAFFILAINPPVSDFAPPRVDVHAAPLLQQAGGAVAVDLFVEDNAKLAGHDFHLLRDGAEVPLSLAPVSASHYRATATGLAAGTYVLQASARDASGHVADARANFTVVPKALTVDLPAGGVMDQATDQVLVKAGDASLKPCAIGKGNVAKDPPCVRTVQLQLSSGKAIDAEYSSAFGGWQATSNFAGWSTGDNNFTVSLQMLDNVVGSAVLPGGNLTAGPFNVTVATPVGTYAPKVANQPVPGQRRVPGLETPALVVGLVALVAVARRRLE